MQRGASRLDPGLVQQEPVPRGDHWVHHQLVLGLRRVLVMGNAYPGDTTATERKVMNKTGTNRILPKNEYIQESKLGHVKIA